jgi:ferredoxin-NADP reductase
MSIKSLIKPIKLNYKGKTQLSNNAYIFDFLPSKTIEWHAGQHASFEIPMPTGRNRRKTFSIASAPGEGIVSIATRIIEDRPDMYKKSLLRLKKGTEVKMRGPIGPMWIKDYSKHYAMLATGIGITPFRAILKQLALDGITNIEVTLFFVGDKDNHFFKEGFLEIKSVLKNIRLEYIYKPDRITGHLLEEKLGKDLYSTVFLLAGSPNMVKSYSRTLQGLKIRRKNIIRNPFLRKVSSIPKVVLPKKPNLYSD